MARIFITGSVDGIGLMAANLHIQGSHQVLLHARNHQRAKEGRKQNCKDHTESQVGNEPNHSAIELCSRSATTASANRC